MRRPVYLDWNATTPVDPRVVEAMLPCFTEDFGNAASAAHAYGWKAAARVQVAREAIAAGIGAEPEEIVFTSGATEANGLAILGVARAERSAREGGSAGSRNHLVVAATEHRAVLDPCRQLEREGFEVTRVAPLPDGRVLAEAVAEALRPSTLLVSVMAANNETGALNPVGAIGELCAERGVLFHTDATQAVGKVPFDLRVLAADLVSLSAHKLSGPKGVGALRVRRGRPRVVLEPQMLGGGHERGLRSGTLDVPGIVGFGVALELALAALPSEGERVRALRDRLHAALSASVPGLLLNGPLVERLPNTLNVSFPGVDAAKLMSGARDVAVSSGSACSSASPEPSHVLLAMGLSPERARTSIRFSLGRTTTAEEIDFAAAVVARAAAEANPAAGGPP